MNVCTFVIVSLMHIPEVKFSRLSSAVRKLTQSGLKRLAVFCIKDLGEEVEKSEIENVYFYDSFGDLEAAE